MCCCDICLDLGVEALKWFGNVVMGSLRDSQSGKVLDGGKNGEKNGEKNGVIVTRRGSSRAMATVKDDSELRHNIVCNPTFADGTSGWFGLGCSLAAADYHGSNYCIATGRTQRQQGLAQEIGKRLEVDVEYRVEAWVGIRNWEAEEELVQATFKLGTLPGVENDVLLNSVTVRKGEWSLLTGNIRIRSLPERAVVCFHGPNGGVDLLVSSVAIVPSSTSSPELQEKENNDLQTLEKTLRKQTAGPSLLKDPKYGVNIIKNSNLMNGLDDWYAMGNCHLGIGFGGPRFLGACAQKSFVNSPPPTLSGKFLYTSNRTETWEGPAQTITDEIQLFNSYQVSAWVAVIVHGDSSDSVAPQAISVSIDVDGEWRQGGEVLTGPDWTEVSGSFRLETKPEKVMVYFQGPAPGVDVMVAGLHIFAVDRLARVPLLQQETDKVRKRDVVMKIRDGNGDLLPAGTQVFIEQTKNNFPLGTCINDTSLDDKRYREFFLRHFNWAVFDWELKWDQTEAKEGEITYTHPDNMAEFCNSNNVPMRGHCIVWEVEEAVPTWARGLEGEDLLEAVENRFTSLLSRYKGQFRHYDVNNEILHGSFYKERLGTKVLPYMFKLANELDSTAKLFLNDYNVENGADSKSSPQKYVELVKFLQDNGAPVGGIGLQGHLTVPVGPIIFNALDMLSRLDLPVWFTEIDVPSLNEYVRADDLEVVLREAFAHPVVEGCMLWGFWEGAMSTKNAHLVNSDGSCTEAGRRLFALKEEWTTSLNGIVDTNGEVTFRGYLGNYNLSVQGTTKAAVFEITEGESAAVLDLTTEIAANLL